MTGECVLVTMDDAETVRYFTTGNPNGARYVRTVDTRDGRRYYEHADEITGPWTRPGYGMPTYTPTDPQPARLAGEP